jgi:chromosome segregation ATPase
LDCVQLTTSLASKSKKSRKKKNAAKDKTTDQNNVNGVKDDGESGEEGHEESTVEDTEISGHNSTDAANGALPADDETSKDLNHLKIDGSRSIENLTNGSSTMGSSNETEAKLEALAKERSELRDEVTRLRRLIEELQEKHNEEISNLQTELEETQGEKEEKETQYRNLLGRVNTIKSQLGERLKSDAVSLKDIYQR